MNYKSIDPEKQCCAFGFFDIEGNLIGYRQDTFNTMGTDFAKVYHYSDRQVKTVLDGINTFVKSDRNHAVEILQVCGYGEIPEGKSLMVKQANKHRNDRRELRELNEFEVRVLPAPEKEGLEIPDLSMWLMQAPELEPLEIYKFKL